MLQLGEARYLQASFPAVDWVRNLRTAGEARLSRGRGRWAVAAPGALARLLQPIRGTMSGQE